MPKKHIENVPSLADFQAPWETPAGEVDIDKAKLKKYIHGIVTDAAKRADRAEEAEAKVAAAEKAATDAQTELAKGDQSGKITELTEKLAKAEAEGGSAARDLLRIKVGDEAGLTIKQSLRLQGDDEDALKADAVEILETFGGKKVEETDEEREAREEAEAEAAEEAESTGLVRVTRLNNPVDTRGRDGGSTSEIDVAAAVSQMPQFSRTF